MRNPFKFYPKLGINAQMKRLLAQPHSQYKAEPGRPTGVSRVGRPQGGLNGMTPVGGILNKGYPPPPSDDQDGSGHVMI